jgi:hypothetical protein
MSVEPMESTMQFDTSAPVHETDSGDLATALARSHTLRPI